MGTSYSASEQTKKISNPEVFGPGKWDSIHDLTCNVTSIEEAKMITYSVKKIIYSIKCDCVKHAIQYLNDNNIDNSIGEPDQDGVYIGLARWGYMFHNTVNNRLGKKLMSWETFREIYINRGTTCAK